MESMKSQAPSTKPGPAQRGGTPKEKLQINLKFQYSMTKTQNRFGISDFGHCDLFVICDL